MGVSGDIIGPAAHKSSVFLSPFCMFSPIPEVGVRRLFLAIPASRSSGRSSKVLLLCYFLGQAGFGASTAHVLNMESLTFNMESLRLSARFF